MRENGMIKKNLDLMTEFMKYAFDHTEILDRIPRDAQLDLLPSNDPELYRENRKTLYRLRRTKQKHVVFKIESYMPKIEFVESVELDENVV